MLITLFVTFGIGLDDWFEIINISCFRKKVKSVSTHLAVKRKNKLGIFVDRVYRLPRIWSNKELKKVAHLFRGRVVNVSGWKDLDKEGRRYRDYFVNANSYTITNYKPEARGFQGYEGEIFLDLEKELPSEMINRFDTVFNHTTLEHIYDVKTAFLNLCSLTTDIVILVLPFLQQYHSTYGDYWRFTPLVIKKMFEDNSLELVYQSFNSNYLSSVYIFSIASKKPAVWNKFFNWNFTCEDPKGRGPEPFVGSKSIPNINVLFKNRSNYSHHLKIRKNKAKKT